MTAGRVLLILAVWTAISVPFGIFVGRYIKAGRRHWPGERLG